MSKAYLVLTNRDLLKEITKWHISHYIHFPNIFIQKLSNPKNLDKLRWLLNEQLITINTLNKLVQNIYSYGKIDNDAYLNIQTFTEHILLAKKCPKLLSFIFNNYPNEQFYITDKVLNSKRIQRYLKDNFKERTWLYKILNIPLPEQPTISPFQNKTEEQPTEPLTDLFNQKEHIQYYCNSLTSTQKFNWLHDNSLTEFSNEVIYDFGHFIDALDGRVTDNIIGHSAPTGYSSVRDYANN